jgi:hypothetical protein
MRAAGRPARQGHITMASIDQTKFENNFKHGLDVRDGSELAKALESAGVSAESVWWVFATGLCCVVESRIEWPLDSWFSLSAPQPF